MITDLQMAILVKRIEDKRLLIEFVSSSSVYKDLSQKQLIYFINLSLTKLSIGNFSSHLKLVDALNIQSLKRFIPGILSAYFKILKAYQSAYNENHVDTIYLHQSSAKIKWDWEEKIANSISTILEKVDEIRMIDQHVIHGFFTRYNASKAFLRVFVKLKNISRPEFKELYILHLILFDHEITDDEYNTVIEYIKSNLNTDLAFDLINKLAGRGRLCSEKSLISDLIINGSNVLNSALFSIKEGMNPIFCENLVSEVLLSGSFDICEKYYGMYLNKALKLHMPIGILQKYLEHPNIAETTFYKVFDYKSHSYDSILSICQENIENIMILRNVVLYYYEIRLNSFVYDILAIITRNSEDLEKCFGYFEILYHLLTLDTLERALLFHIYDELIYLDISKPGRIAIFKLFGLLLRQYSVLDCTINAIKDKKSEIYADVNGDDKTSVSNIDIVSQLSHLNITNYEKIMDEEIKNIDIDNCNVLAAGIWEEILYLFDDDSSWIIIETVVQIIRSTGAFYTNRMQTSGFLKKILSFFSRQEYLSTSHLRLEIEFLTLISKFFTIDKKNLEKIVEFIYKMKNYDVFDDIIDILIQQDKYYIFYMFFGNYSVEENKIIKAIIRRKLRSLI